MIFIEPGGETAMLRANRLNPPGVLDGGLDLEPVADDARIAEESRHVLGLVSGHPVDVEAIEGIEEGLALLEDGEPGQAGLVDLQHQPLEQHRIVPRRETVFGVVVGAVKFMSGRHRAIGRAHISPRKLIRSDRIMSQMMTEITAATPVVTAALSHKRGRIGAPGACPGTISPARGGRTPQGRTANTTTHHTST